MISFRLTSGAPQALQHAVAQVDQDLDLLLERLSTREQNHFWNALRAFSLTQMEGKGRNAPLEATGAVNDSVREALETIDSRIATHTEKLGNEDRRRFWELLHEESQAQAEDTKQPQARHGGGGA